MSTAKGRKPVFTKEESTKRRQFRQQRNQAQFRKEPWDFTYEEWSEWWGTDYEHRGRSEGQYIMKRNDIELPWDQFNCFKYLYTGHSKYQGHNRK